MWKKVRTLSLAKHSYGGSMTLLSNRSLSSAFVLLGFQFFNAIILIDVSEISKVLTDIEKAKEEAEDVVSMRIEVQIHLYFKLYTHYGV